MDKLLQAIPRWIFAFAALLVAGVLFIAFIYPANKPLNLGLLGQFGYIQGTPLPIPSILPVGTIIASVVEPTIFQRKNPDWHLADGSRVSPKTGFASNLGRTTLPDLRGVFLRGINVTRSDQYADPNGERLAGEMQASEIVSHLHSTYLSMNGWPKDSGDRTRDGKPNYLLHPSMAGQKGKIKTNAYGGKETRPSNAAVYYYVKIN